MPVYLAHEFAVKTALRLSFVAPWTWAEFERMRQKIEAYAAKRSQAIDLIIDVSMAGDSIPNDAFIRIARAYGDSTIRQQLVVGASQKIRELLAMAEHYYTALGGFASFICVQDLQEAWQILRKHQSSAP